MLMVQPPWRASASVLDPAVTDGGASANRFDYWGVPKSFPGFMPVADRAWVPS